MRYVQSLEEITLDHSWVSIGTYDGVHRGHQSLLQAMMSGARGENQPTVVVTFHPHPREVVNSASGVFYLTLPDERAALLGALGIDVVVVLPFTKAMANTSAIDFVQPLASQLGMAQLWVGQDFALGKAREGNIPRLRHLGLELGYSVVEVAALAESNETISSSRIRGLISSGELQTASRLLGRKYQLTGEVVPGDQRGRRIGIPTANISPPKGKLIPAPGVYACLAEVNGITHAAAINIGVRPTFGDESSAMYIEAHLLDFVGDIYGSSLSIQFQQRLRDEMRFESVDDLVKQVKSDILKTREIVSALNY